MFFSMDTHPFTWVLSMWMQSECSRSLLNYKDNQIKAAQKRSEPDNS